MANEVSLGLIPRSLLRGVSLCEAGVNIKVIQDALGHADISTTLNIYADVTKELKRDEFAGLDLYFKKSPKQNITSRTT